MSKPLLEYGDDVKMGFEDTKIRSELYRKMQDSVQWQERFAEERQNQSKKQVAVSLSGKSGSAAREEAFELFRKEFSEKVSSRILSTLPLPRFRRSLDRASQLT
jgi:hypothetical protein